MPAKRHHFLSQFYLRGFTCEQPKKSKCAKESQLAVIDIKRNKSFVTTPLNVGVENDFNTIEREGIAPDYLEQELSKIEDKVATAIKNLRKTLDFSGETRGMILNFMTLIVCRSPKMRGYLRQIEAQIAESIMSTIFDSKEMYESEIHNLKKNYNLDVNISYEDAKKLFESKKYTIEVSREEHIRTEMSLIDTILPYLFDRRWLLLIADKKSGPFITTDSPVNLLWKYPEKISPFLRDSPGFGLKETQVYFPISQELALIGEFDGDEKNVNATENLVAMFNSMMICNCPEQIYAPKLDFKFWDKENNILSGKDLLEYIST